MTRKEFWKQVLVGAGASTIVAEPILAEPALKGSSIDEYPDTLKTHELPSGVTFFTLHCDEFVSQHQMAGIKKDWEDTFWRRGDVPPILLILSRGMRLVKTELMVDEHPVQMHLHTEVNIAGDPDMVAKAIVKHLRSQECNIKI